MIKMTKIILIPKFLKIILCPKFLKIILCQKFLKIIQCPKSTFVHLITKVTFFCADLKSTVSRCARQKHTHCDKMTLSDFSGVDLKTHYPIYMQFKDGLEGPQSSASQKNVVCIGRSEVAFQVTFELVCVYEDRTQTADFL
jgi:hypothetical protein